MKIIKSFLTILLLAFLLVPFAQSAKAQTSNYTLTIASNKASIKPGEDFSITITAKNTSSSRINNFEIRVPFINNIEDVAFQGESPSFNRALTDLEYPAGFNSRSWIINTFDPNETSTFTLKYKATSDPKTPNGLLSNITLPVTWVDPAGLESNKLLTLRYIRADVYLNRQYNQSFNANLPSLQSLNSPISLVSLNAKYTATGSKTTNLKTITTENIKSFPNFTLESQDILIEWLAPLDLSASNVPSQLTNLDSNLKTEWGKMTFTETNLPFFANKPVRVTFKDTNFIIEPKAKVGTEIKDLKDVKGNFSVGTKTIVFEQDKLPSILAIVPEIQLEEAVIETDQERVEVKGKVADPRTPIIYKVDNQENTLSTIDISTGEFSFNVDIANGTKQIEISTKYRNNEETKKVAIVRKIEGTPTPQPTNASGGTISEPINGITLGLILAAIGTVAIIAGIIYYLYRSKGKNKKDNLNLDPVIVNKVGGIGTRDDNKVEGLNPPIETKQTFDLASLKNKYSLENPSEENISKPEKPVDKDKSK